MRKTFKILILVFFCSLSSGLKADDSFLWEGGRDLGDGWKQSPWLSYIHTEFYPYVYVWAETNWIWVLDQGTENNSNDIWCWDYSLATWRWNSQNQYPKAAVLGNGWFWVQVSQDIQSDGYYIYERQAWLSSSETHDYCRTRNTSSSSSSSSSNSSSLSSGSSSSSSSSSSAAELVSLYIENPGFEWNYSGWDTVEDIAISGEVNSGNNALKIADSTGYISQEITVNPNDDLILSAYIKGDMVLGAIIDGVSYSETFSFSDYGYAEIALQSGSESSITIFASYAGSVARVDDFELWGTEVESSSASSSSSSSSSSTVSSSSSSSNSSSSSSSSNDGVLDPTLPPSDNFDLSHWKITLPDGDDQEVSWVNAGNESENEFYTDPVTGGMVFRCPNQGGTTSSSTKYSRTELREMLRGDAEASSANNTNTTGLTYNNWVTSAADSSVQSQVGGVDGTLKATLSVDHVSTTYSDTDSYMLGRVIVGQIHASGDEPCKLYYRKLPGNTKGSIYFAYELWGSDDVKYDLIGSNATDAADPEDGVELGEIWSYTIQTLGRELTVTIEREGKEPVTKTITMESAYDNDWMYFKAGVYNQNNGGEDDDYVQATFYSLEHTHP